jgi:hypothetical protein
MLVLGGVGQRQLRYLKDALSSSFKFDLPSGFVANTKY